MAITTSYPTGIDTFGGVIEQGSQEPNNKVAQAVLALEKLNGIVPGTASCAKTIATAASAVTFTVASGSMRQITSIKRACVVTISATGAYNGQIFTLVRNATGAHTVAVNATVTYAATATVWGSMWQLQRGAWRIIGSYGATA
jgi:hypothetical protein